MGGGGWQTKFSVYPRSRSFSSVLGPSGPDLGPDLDLTWDLDLDLSLTIRVFLEECSANHHLPRLAAV